MSSPRSARAAACTSPSLLVASSVVMVSLDLGGRSTSPVRPREAVGQERFVTLHGQAMHKQAFLPKIQANPTPKES